MEPNSSSGLNSMQNFEMKYADNQRINKLNQRYQEVNVFFEHHFDDKGLENMS